MFREERDLAKNNETVDNNSQDFFLLKETSKGAARMFKVFWTYVNGINEQNKNGVRRCNKISFIRYEPFIHGKTLEKLYIRNLKIWNVIILF